MTSSKISNFLTPSLHLSPQLSFANHSKSSFLLPLTSSSIPGLISFMNGPLCNLYTYLIFKKKYTKILRQGSSVTRISRNTKIYSPKARPKGLKIRRRLVGAVFKKITSIMSVIKENEMGKYNFCSFFV